MFVVLFIKIYENKVKYDKFFINKKAITRYKRLQSNIERRTKPISIPINGITLHYFLRELIYCDKIRLNILNSSINSIRFNLHWTNQNTIDYNWNERITYLIRERCELDHTLSWLSTLGGAFSALGDYFANMAETAGKISIHQLKLALRIGDPTIQARCRLYFSLSLIQKRYYRYARRIIENEYQNALNAHIRDERLLKMCKGIWSKLKYEYDMHKLNGKLQVVAI